MPCFHTPHRRTSQIVLSDPVVVTDPYAQPAMMQLGSLAWSCMAVCHVYGAARMALEGWAPPRWKGCRGGGRRRGGALGQPDQNNTACLAFGGTGRSDPRRRSTRRGHRVTCVVAVLNGQAEVAGHAALGTSVRQQCLLLKGPPDVRALWFLRTPTLSCADNCRVIRRYLAVELPRFGARKVVSPAEIAMGCSKICAKQTCVTHLVQARGWDPIPCWRVRPLVLDRPAAAGPGETGSCGLWRGRPLWQSDTALLP